MKNLKILREKEQMSQQKLAEQFHLSQQSIYKYENNLAEPDISTLKEFAKFFGTTVDYLIGNSDYEDQYDLYLELQPTKQELDHLLSYRKLSSSLQSAVDTIMDEYHHIKKEN